MLQMGHIEKKDSWGVEVAESSLEGETMPDGAPQLIPFRPNYHFRGREMQEKLDQKESWVVEVEKLFESETRPIKFPGGVIHTVPKSLLSKNTEAFYYPQVVSLGPCHFKEKEKLDGDEMELLKAEIAKKVHHEIVGDLKYSDMVESHSLFETVADKKRETYAENGNERLKKKGKRIMKIYAQSGRGLKSVLESFKRKEKKIKKSYARNFEYSGEVCAWMIARDACFVLEVFERFRKDEDSDFHHILNRKRHHPLLTEIVKDLFKMENQLPFWALKEIRPDIDNWHESALKNLSPIEVAEGNNRWYSTKVSLLQLLHDYIVDRPLPVVSLPAAPDTTSGSKCRWIITSIYWTIVVVLSPFLLIMFIIFVIQECISPKLEMREHSPTVEELRKLGLKFKKLQGQELGISHIKFKESNSTLYLPHIKVDNRSEVILRNLIALEICSEEEEKPITRYVILMNDLINTREDVGILRRADIITSKLGSDEEIAQFWNSMLTSTEMPRYDPIDFAVLGINHYRKKWWKVLWAQFLMTYCSKPWLFISLLAGLLLLLLTTTQVVCLFASCQIKSSH